MTLLVDIGNTRVKWARAHGRLLVERGQASHEEGLEPVFEQWGCLERPMAVRAVCVASDALTAGLASWVARNWDLEMPILRSAAESNGIRSGYSTPQRLGADRWAALIGAWSRAQAPAVIVDAGSAVTLDAVTGDGSHLGGLILPGLTLMRQSLNRGTARLPLTASTQIALFGQATDAAIGSGTLLGLAGSIDALAGAMSSRLGKARLWLTGGDAPTLAPYLKGAFEHVPDLVLEGLLAADSDWR